MSLITKKNHINSKKFYLYYKPSSKFCKELLSIIISIPDLAQQLKCIDAEKYQVKGIKWIPAIKDDETGKLYEANEAFAWVLIQCNHLVVNNKLKKEVILNLEQRIKSLTSSTSNAKLPTNPTTTTTTKTGLKGLSDQNLANINTQDRLFDQTKIMRTKTPVVKKAITEDHKSLIEQAKKKWIQDGEVDKNGNSTQNFRRAYTPSIKKITDTDLKNYNKNQEEMLKKELERYKHVPRPFSTPMVRKQTKMGTQFQ